ncbi:MAG: thioesterase family protein [Clostridia bacterium]
MLNIGLKGKSSTIVCENNTAKTMGSGELDVFATPAMIALMEQAAAKSVKEFLDETQSTVGTLMNVKHLSASPVGANITAESEIIEIDRKRLVFCVKAFDNGGVIGEGIHERFIIDAEKFMSKTLAKI